MKSINAPSGGFFAKKKIELSPVQSLGNSTYVQSPHGADNDHMISAYFTKPTIASNVGTRMQIAVIPPSPKFTPVDTDTSTTPRESPLNKIEAEEETSILGDKIGKFIATKVFTKTTSSQKNKAPVTALGKGSVGVIDPGHALKKSGRNIKGVNLFTKEATGQSSLKVFGSIVPARKSENSKTAYNNVEKQKPATSGYSGMLTQNSSRKVPGSKKKI
jgi:hypothetical protein